MKIKDLIKILQPLDVRGEVEIEVKGITADSRQVQAGYIFVAIAGENFDGADFMAEAKARGAVGLVVREFYPLVNGGLAQIRVEDPRKALAILSNEFFGHPARQLKMIGVTGTNGKTTVAILTRTILEDAGISTGLLSTIYYQIGERWLPSDLTTPPPPHLQILLGEMKKAGCSHVVMEVSSHALKQGRVEGIEFQAAIFTNLSSEHLDYHRTLDDYRDSKIKLFESLRSGSVPLPEKVAILNADDPLSREIRNRVEALVITYGLHPHADLKASEIELAEEGTSFRLTWRGKTYPARLRLLGRHNVYNALAAAALGISEGLAVEQVLASLEKVGGITGRLEAVRAGQDFHVLVDFAHTPAALENALQTIREIYSQRLIVVFGCGGDRDRSKRPLMGRAADRWADVVILTSDNPRTEDEGEIIKEILNGLTVDGEKIRVVPDRRRAIETAFSLAGPRDVVLIAGKGHEQRQIFRDRIVPFSDREVSIDILQGRQSGETE